MVGGGCRLVVKVGTTFLKRSIPEKSYRKKAIKLKKETVFYSDNFKRKVLTIMLDNALAAY
jgi:hypothetical protein